MEHLSKKHHIESDGASSTLFFITVILPSKPGIQTRTNFNNFLWKCFFWRNSTVVLSKYAITQSKLVCLLKLSVSYTCYVSLSISVKFRFAKTSPGFSCRLFFLFIFIFCSLSESSLSILSALSSNASSSPS